jgi:prephenate dehydrogenase
MNSPRPIISEESVAIAGVGLIGGSIAAALKIHGYPGPIIGLGRNQARLDAAKSAGLIDVATTDVASIAIQPSLWIFCTPVDRIVAGIQQAAALARPDTVFTDAGSTKQSICEELGARLENQTEFVGSHPLAGSEKNGYEHADPEIFKNRLCVITPSDSNTMTAIDRVEQFWQSLGMRTVSTSPSEHDRLLATTSHLPHVVAAALVSLIDEENQSFAATGFRDTTRVAGGDPDLWTAILSRNSQHVTDAIRAMRQSLKQFQNAVSNNDEAAIRKLLTDGQRARKMLSGDQNSSENLDYPGSS